MTDEQKTETDPNYREAALSLDVEERRAMMPTSGGSMQPSNLGEMMEFARILSASTMLPDDYRGKPGNVMVAIQMGQELGLPAMQAIQNIAVIKGRPSLWGDAMLAVVRAHPQFAAIQEMDLKDITAAGEATCILQRKGEPPRTVTFSVDDAKRAELWGKKGPWQTYPSRMLQLRARAFACRDVFPDALRGIQSAEEARDITEVEAVATVKSSAPSSIVDRIKSRQVVEEPAAPPAAALEPDNDPDPAPPEPNNGEMTEAEEEAIARAEAEAMREEGQ